MRIHSNTPPAFNALRLHRVESASQPWHCTKNEFSMNNFFTFTEEILNGKLHLFVQSELLSYQLPLSTLSTYFYNNRIKDGPKQFFTWKEVHCSSNLLVNDLKHSNYGLDDAFIDFVGGVVINLVFVSVLWSLGVQCLNGKYFLFHLIMRL